VLGHIDNKYNMYQIISSSIVPLLHTIIARVVIPLVSWWVSVDDQSMVIKDELRSCESMFYVEEYGPCQPECVPDACRGRLPERSYECVDLPQLLPNTPLEYMSLSSSVESLLLEDSALVTNTQWSI
jgi:hypothetical protein